MLTPTKTNLNKEHWESWITSLENMLEQADAAEELMFAIHINSAIEEARDRRSMWRSL